MRRIIRICAICIIVLMTMLYVFPVFRIAELVDPSSYYKEELCLLVYRGSIEDWQKARHVIAIADEAFSDISHTEEENLLTYGALYRYSTDSDRGASGETHEIKLLSAHFDETTGYVWVRYSNIAYDAEGNMVHGSNGILSLWYLEKDDMGEWVVTYIKECP